MQGKVAFFEIPGEDLAMTEAFYGALFGWRFDEANLAGYRMVSGAGVLGGAAGGDASRAPRIFFDTDDIGTAVARVVELGGSAAEIVQIPSGRFVRCADDQGVAFTLWQDA